MKIVPQLGSKKLNIEEMTKLLNTALEGKNYMIDLTTPCISEIKISMTNNNISSVRFMYDKIAVITDQPKDITYWPIEAFEKQIDKKFLKTFIHFFEDEKKGVGS